MKYCYVTLLSSVNYLSGVVALAVLCVGRT